MNIRTLARIVTLAGLFVTAAFAADTAKVLFEDKFSARPDASWRWIRERPEAWRIADGALMIDTLPGSYWQMQDSSKNTLLRPAPASAKNGFIVEVLLENEPKKQYEHAGIILYFDGLNHVALNKEFLGKQSLIIAAAQDGKPTLGPEKEYREREVWLRLVVRGTKAPGQFRSTEKEPWQTLGELAIPSSTKKLLVGIHSGYGLEKPERHARIRNFRILQATE